MECVQLSQILLPLFANRDGLRFQLFFMAGNSQVPISTPCPELPEAAVASPASGAPAGAI